MKKTGFKMKTTGLLLLAGILIFGACKKDDKDNTPRLSEEQIDAYAGISTKISAQMQSSALGYYTKAIEKGFTGTIPGMGSKKAGTEVNSVSTDKWNGPDSKGWYTRYWESYGYKYSEKLRTRGDTVEHIHLVEYNGADAQYKYEINTLYFKYTKNKKDLYKGHTVIEEHSSGYSNMSRTYWKMTFNDWDPSNGAGIFDWYWGVSENSGWFAVPTHRFLHISATPTINNMLRVRVIIYDDRGVEVWDFEYETPFEPVDMSDYQ